MHILNIKNPILRLYYLKSGPVVADWTLPYDSDEPVRDELRAPSGNPNSRPEISSDLERKQTLSLASKVIPGEV